MPAPTPSDFRVALPEFADDARYTDAQIQMYLTIGANLVNAKAWGSTYNFGVFLVAGHYLAMSARDQDVVFLGGTPGEANGAVNSKAVDKVSVSYDTASTSVKDAGQWNATTYGQRYRSLCRTFGAGGLQI